MTKKTQTEWNDQPAVGESEADLFNEKNIPPSNWWKAEKVGDQVSGEVMEIFDKPSTDPKYPDQRVFVLKKKDGELVNVGIKKTSEYLMSRTNRVAVGDTFGIKFEKEIPSTVKGFNPAKSLVPYWRPKEGVPVEE